MGNVGSRIRSTGRLTVIGRRSRRGAAGAQSNVAKLTVLRCIPAESSLRASVRLSAGDCDAGSRSRAAFGRGPDRNQSPSPSWLIFAVATSSIMLRSF